MTQDRLAFLDGAPLPVLGELLENEDARQRADAACALGDRLRTREIDSYGTALQERLVLLLADPVLMVRFEAAIALAEAREPRAIEILIGALKYRTLRLDAIRALGAMGDKGAVAPLIKIMRRFLMPWADRLQAAAALCALGDQTGAVYLKSRLKSRRMAEQAAAVHFLGESHHPEALAILEGIVVAADHPARDTAVRALGLLGDPAARPTLEAARQGADDELLADIETALTQIARRN